MDRREKNILKKFYKKSRILSKSTKQILIQDLSK